MAKRRTKSGGPTHGPDARWGRRRPPSPRPPVAPKARGAPATVSTPGAEIGASSLPVAFPDAIPAVLLHGGGVESTAVMFLLARARVEFAVLHLDYGQPRFDAEASAIKTQCGIWRIPYIARALPPALTRRVTTKNRNAYLVSYAFTQANRVYVGFSKDGHYADADDGFVRLYNEMLQRYEPKSELIAPFGSLSKFEAHLTIRALQPAYVYEYWTCNVGPVKPCGKCTHCRQDASWKKLFAKTPLDDIEWVPDMYAGQSDDGEES